MNQDATPAPKPVIYTDNELQMARDVIKDCAFVSDETREYYCPPIALWIHYCNKYCKGNVEVTDSRLADYFGWLVDSGVAESMRQDNEHIQLVLFTELRGVWCYWRIQNEGITTNKDPRKSHVFLTKWNSIIQRYPYKRQPRHNQAIYSPASSL
ncbi:hypothetical protein GGI18_000767 [Coemansia linderi]|uniref:Uncharacterized protein n=1 Tax=Coemansia linderi TaxID=2663919 RepID=A0ACC1KM22_9FUNG|nr:hypothetical protein GGI18_000767 [Coemansia linderi]